jgi:excinuclease UvrABC nuclease subunit
MIGKPITFSIWAKENKTEPIPSPTFQPTGIVELTPQDIKPGVYQFFQGSKCIYVGSSCGSVISRATATNHHKAEIRSSADKILITFCNTMEEAVYLESYLIQELCPKYNVCNPIENWEKSTKIKKPRFNFESF